MSKLKLFREYLGLLLIAIYLLFFSSCQQHEKKSIQQDICGLASPLVFFSDTLKLNLQDYFVDPQIVSEISLPDQVESVPSSKNFNYSIIRKKGLPPLSSAKFITQNRQEYSILIKNLEKEKVVISFDPGENKYKEVRVKGSLNFWNLNLSKMKQEEGLWVEEFELIPGEYRYVLVADGREIVDSSNPDSIDNNIGGYNSILKVGRYNQSELPFIKTLSADKASILIKSNEPLKEVIAFWENSLIEVDLDNKSVVIHLPEYSKQLKRSFIRIYAYNDKGISNDILVPLEYGKAVMHQEELTRLDRQSMIMYFMMIDRFRNGNPENDEPVNDPEILPQANYFGGDLQGVLDVMREGYFDSLGLNTIWVSPITQNPTTAYGLYKEPHTRFSGYHGYWPVSSVKIDHRFGTDEIFKTLVNEAHKMDKNIILDYVANHVHELHPVYRNNPGWATNLYLPDGSLNTEKWEEQRLTTWFDTFLPTLDLRKAEVVDPMTDSAVYWVEEFGIDGIRHDATKHIDELFWRTLTRKLKQINVCNPMAYQIGETYGSPELINSYISTGMLDGQFDFNVYDDAIAVFARDSESFDRLRNSLTQSLRYYGYHNLMGYITGNQDRPRFISLAGGSLRFDEDSKYAGWNREIGVGDPIAYKKLKMLHAFNLTIPGIPIIYYGDEIGIPGGNDPDNRRQMIFAGLSEEQSSVKETVARLIDIRKNNLPLLYGQTRFLRTDKDVLVYERIYFDKSALVVYNKSTEDVLVDLEISSVKSVKAEFGSEIIKKGDKLHVKLAPVSFDIILY